MPHATVRIGEMYIGFNIHVNFRNINDLLNKYEFIYHHMEQFKTHKYWCANWFMHKNKFFNDV